MLNEVAIYSFSALHHCQGQGINGFIHDDVGDDDKYVISPKTSSVELLPVRVIEFLGPEKFD